MSNYELLDVVDNNDVIVGQDSKENKFAKGFISRNVAIFIVDGEGNLLITKRAPDKKTFPNRYDLAACGNVKAGESYFDAAEREVDEELSIKCELKLLKKIFNEFKDGDKELRYFTGIFLGKFSGDVSLNEELVELKRLSLEEVSKLVEQDESLFTPGFVNDFILTKNELKSFIF